MFKIGDRVVCQGGGVGIVEAIEGDWCDVRMRTPNDDPSCCIEICLLANLGDGTNVMPQPRSRAWWMEANAFIGQVNAAACDMVNNPTD